jgi:hypothetical protein
MSSARRFRARAIPAALLVLGLVAAPAAPALAEEEAPDPAISSAEFVVAPQDPVIREDADAAFGLLIRNAGEQAIPSGTIELRLSVQPVGSPEDLDAQPTTPSLHLAEARVGETAPESEQAATISVPQDDLPALETRGVYTVRAVFRPDPSDDTQTSDALSAVTPVVWRGPGPPDADAGGGSGANAGTGAEIDADAGAGVRSSVRLGVIVPVVLPSDIRTLPTRSQLGELAPAWDRLLTQARAHRATLAIDPRVIAGIRAYGDEAPENAGQFLERLEQSSLPSFLLQFADADPAAQAALGFTSLLAPSSLDFVSRFGSFPLESSGEGGGADAPASGADDGAGADGADAGEQGSGAEGDRPETSGEATGTSAASDPDETAGPSDPAGDAGTREDSGTREDTDAPEDPEAPTLPALEDLLSWPQGAATAWPANGTVDSATLELLRASGIETAVLGSGNVSASDATRSRISRSDVLITDDALGDEARATLSAATAAERAAGAARLAARLAFAAQSGSEGTLLGLDRGAMGSSEDPALLLELLASLDWVVPTSVSELPEGTASLRAGGTSEDRLELLRSAASRESSVTELGAVLVNPEYLSGYQRTRLLELFATRHASPTVDFDGLAAQYRERDAELLEGVRVISTEHTQLVGSSTRIPVQLRNALPFDAIVAVQVEPSSAALSITERRFPDVLVPAEANERVLVPVLSRVSSGESGLVVTVSAATGDPTVFTSTLPVSISSSFETIALWVIGSLAALLLGFGTWRSVRRRRQLGASAGTATRTADTAATGTAE